jgi:catechol 2,3-dioxygenase-like lactoylglutathione lyase family enzyme
MFNYLTVGTNDLDAAVAFYDALMAEMGARRVYRSDRSAGWNRGSGTPMFVVIKPFDAQRATIGNGTMVAFEAPSPEKVAQWHAKALALGGVNEGDPGMRGMNLYAAYWRDLDGNKCNFGHFLPAPPANA